MASPYRVGTAPGCTSRTKLKHRMAAKFPRLAPLAVASAWFLLFWLAVAAATVAIGSAVWVLFLFSLYLCGGDHSGASVTTFFLSVLIALVAGIMPRVYEEAKKWLKQ